MKISNQYIIPFKGLKEGDHFFEFDLGKAFFDEHEIFEAKDGQVKVRVSLEKKGQLLMLDISMEGFINVTCDRCLEYFDFPVKINSKLIVKFGLEADTSNEEIWVVDHDEHELDLKQYFLDIIAVNLPIQKFHPVDPKTGLEGCDKNMLELLGKHKFSDNGPETINDPRWNKLKNLLNDYNNN